MMSDARPASFSKVPLILRNLKKTHYGGNLFYIWCQLWRQALTACDPP